MRYVPVRKNGKLAIFSTLRLSAGEKKPRRAIKGGTFKSIKGKNRTAYRMYG